MRLMLAGDSHGNTNYVRRLVHEAKTVGTQHIVILGDFGLWDHFVDGVRFLDDINNYASRHDIQIIALGGNHDNWPRWNWYVENNPKSNNGFVYIRSNVLLIPKVHTWKWANKTFFVAGGAVSVDKVWRQQAESGPKGHGPETLFWPGEQLTDTEVGFIKNWRVKHTQPIDYLLTHDCSDKTPWKNRLKPDLDSQIHRQRIDRVLGYLRPGMHFHGHMHEQYEWENMVPDSNGEPHYIKTRGLECDGLYYSWGILETDTGQFLWRGEE